MAMKAAKPTTTSTSRNPNNVMPLWFRFIVLPPCLPRGCWTAYSMPLPMREASKPFLQNQPWQFSQTRNALPRRFCSGRKW